MRSRQLRKILNNTGYAVHETNKRICIGSPMCSELLFVDKETFKVGYAIDPFHQGRESLKSEELTFIWDKFYELIKTGELKEIISGNDSTAGMFPVYSSEDGLLIEQFADKFGWPHSTHDGQLMYENTHFRTAKEAIEKGLTELDCEFGFVVDHIRATEEKLNEQRERLIKLKVQIATLKRIEERQKAHLPTSGITATGSSEPSAQTLPLRPKDNFEGNSI